MRRSRASILLLSACALLLGAPAAASADAKRRATELQRATAVASGTSLRKSSRSIARAGRAGRERCTWYEAYRYGKNVFGSKLWEYHQRIDWCWNRRKITYVKRRRWGVVNFPVWDFKGHIASDRAGGRGARFFRGWTQGKFQACAGQFGCWQTKLPWVEMTVYRGGRSSYRTGG